MLRDLLLKVRRNHAHKIVKFFLSVHIVLLYCDILDYAPLDLIIKFHIFHCGRYEFDLFLEFGRFSVQSLQHHSNGAEDVRVDELTHNHKH